jgi:hypothetical protein
LFQRKDRLHAPAFFFLPEWCHAVYFHAVFQPEPYLIGVFPVPAQPSAYLREPRLVPFKRDCRSLLFFRFGFVIRKVPLP